jgi:hypothetical protein
MSSNQRTCLQLRAYVEGITSYVNGITSHLDEIKLIINTLENSESQNIQAVINQQRPIIRQVRIEQPVPVVQPVAPVQPIQPLCLAYPPLAFGSISSNNVLTSNQISRIEDIRVSNYVRCKDFNQDDINILAIFRNMNHKNFNVYFTSISRNMTSKDKKNLKSRIYRRCNNEQTNEYYRNYYRNRRDRLSGGSPASI